MPAGPSRLLHRFSVCLKEDSDGYNDAEEVRPTYRESSYGPLDISLTDLTQSGANLQGSGDAALRKRSSTPLRASSVESASEPKRRKVLADIMSSLLGKTGPDESKMVTLGPAAWKMAKEVFHSLVPLWMTKECNAFMAKYLQLIPKQKKEYEADLQKEVQYDTVLELL